MLKSLALATTLLVGTYADIKANSRLGRSLLGSARRLEDGGDDEADEQMDYSYVANYSIKFQGCDSVTQWNMGEDDDNGVRIKKVNFARFRLCPIDSCSDDNKVGCTSEYGDYIVDLNTFVQSYLEDKQQTEEYNCEYLQENSCGCDNDNVDDEDGCLNTCYANAGMDYCIEDEDQGEQFQAQDYAQCAQFEYEQNDDGNQRRLEEAEEEVQYFIGAYCASDDGDVRLGFFSDDTCTQESSTSYYSLTGSTLPYADESIVSTNCVSCKAVDNDANQDDNYGGDAEDQVKEMCEEVYMYAGKCESYMGIQYPIETGCNYIEGLKINSSRHGGGVIGSVSNYAILAIFLFGATAFLLGSYVYFLRSKLGRAKQNLSSQLY